MHEDLTNRELDESSVSNFSNVSSSSTAPVQFVHSASPPGNPPLDGKFPPSLSPTPRIRLTATSTRWFPNLPLVFPVLFTRLRSCTAFL